MNRYTHLRTVIFGIALLAIPAATPFVRGQNLNNLTAPAMNIPNQGVQITPFVKGGQFVTLNPGLKDFPNYVAGQAVTSVVSPNQKTLLVLTSGYNQMNNSSRQDGCGGFDGVRVRVRHYPTNSRSDSGASGPEHLRWHCLRPERRHLLRFRRR